MHRAKQYYIAKVDFDTYRAHAVPAKVDYYTSCTSHSKIEVVKVMSGCENGDIVKVGKVEINSQVYGYCKVKLRTGDVFDHGKYAPLSLVNIGVLFTPNNFFIEMLYPPLSPHIFATHALWIDLPTTVLSSFKRHFLVSGNEVESADNMAKLDMEELLYSAIHAVNHLILRIACVHCQCDAGDLGTEHEHLFMQPNTSADSKNIDKPTDIDSRRSTQSKPPPR